MFSQIHSKPSPTLIVNFARESHSFARALLIFPKFTFISPSFKALMKRGRPTPIVHFPTGTRKCCQKSFNAVQPNLPSRASPLSQRFLRAFVVGSMAFFIFSKACCHFLSNLDTASSPVAKDPKSTGLPRLPADVPEPFGVLPEFPVSADEDVSDGSESFVILSNPIRDRICFAAFCAAFPVFFTADVVLFAASVAFCSPALASVAAVPAAAIWPSPEDPEFLFPVISSVKALNTFARVTNFPRRVFTVCMIGVNRLIRPWPIEAFKESICRLNTLTWFAHDPDVLAKSPDAADNCCWTNAYLKETFSASVICAVVLPYPFARA